MKLHRLLVPALLAVSSPALAQDEGPETSELELFELNDLMMAETTVASQKARPLRASPGVISRVTREEIVNAGSRDLLDVLQLVPGFFFAVDVEGVVSVGFRGNWGYEGKVLLLIDGQEMNETLYSTFALGNHYLADQIQTVEVIRGPGSAIYGGYAELAVINVITRGASEHDGAGVTATYGQYARGMARRNVTVNAAHTSQRFEGLSGAITASLGQGNRGDGVYDDSTSAPLRLDGLQRTDPVMVNANARYKDLQLTFIYDDYRTTSVDGFGDTLRDGNGTPIAPTVRFKSVLAEARYTVKLTDRLTLTPRLNYKRQQPWQQKSETSDLFYDKVASRYRARLTLGYDVTDGFNVVAGFDGFVDSASLQNPTLAGLQTQFGTANDVRYHNLAGFTEASWDNAIVNVVAGVRYENHSAFGSNFAPRVGLTKMFGAFHAKLLAAGAFRAPSIENINLSVDPTTGSPIAIRPERTRVFELELGYQINEHMFVSANGFDSTIKNPIVYFADPDLGAEGYSNYPLIGSRGVEVDYRVRHGQHYVNASYAFYSAAGQNDVATYRVPAHDGSRLAAPQHRFIVNGYGHLWRGLGVNATAILEGDRYGYVSADTVQRFDASALVNVFLRYEDLGIAGLDAGLGVYNVLAQNGAFIQPYDSGHPPLPGRSREVLARLSYSVGF